MHDSDATLPPDLTAARSEGPDTPVDWAPPETHRRTFQQCLDLLAKQRAKNHAATAPSATAPSPALPQSGGVVGGGQPTDHQVDAIYSAGPQPPDRSDATAVEQKIVDMIQLEVLGELERGGVKVFSLYHRKSHVIPSCSKLTFEDLLQICGPSAKAHVLKSGADDIPGFFPIQEVRDAIALLAGYRRINDQTELGVGCWPGMDHQGHPYRSAVLVGAGEAAEYNGELKLRRIQHPRCGGHLLDFDSGEGSWYCYDRLLALVESCDRKQALKTMNDAISLFGRWRWQHQDAAPIVVTGLMFSTWVQTLWSWRPQVAITGATKTGKSTLFDTIASQFGTLAVKSSQSSAAGIRQAIQNSARPILVDEFEKSKHRGEILEMLRAAGRGDKILRGTTNQKGQSFTLRHIVWLAAIEVGLKRAPDRNRFISLELLPPDAAQAGKLTIPDSQELAELGQRMLAASIRYIHEAVPLASRLKGQRVDGVDNRIVECYAVPAAMLAVLDSGPDDLAGATELLHAMLNCVEKEAVERDEHDLLAAILQAPVNCGHGVFQTVAQLLNCVLANTTKSDAAAESLAKVGLKIDRLHPSQSFNPLKALIVAYGPVSEYILKQTPWYGQSIEVILKRLPGADKTKRRVGGQNSHVVAIPLDYLVTEFLGQEGSEGQESGNDQSNF